MLIKITILSIAGPTSPKEPSSISWIDVPILVAIALIIVVLFFLIKRNNTENNTHSKSNQLEQLEQKDVLMQPTNQNRSMDQPPFSKMSKSLRWQLFFIAIGILGSMLWLIYKFV